MIEKLKITVMLGGPSEERKVSLLSGAGVVKALRSLGHDVFEIDPETPDWVLPPGTDVVCLAPLHGTYGEDGTVQQQLEKLGVPYTGCDAEASRIAFDKVLTKKRCIEAGVPTAKFLVISSDKTPWPMGWQPPLVVKPVRQGSSVGLQFVGHVADWSGALRESLRYDSEVLVEERIVGRETTVGILDNVPLPIVEVRPKSGPYDYRNKYTVGATEYFCPARFDAATTRRVQEAALGAFHAVGGRDYARVDVMLRENGEPVVLEVNTLPGMTETSLLPKAAAAAGINYADLCQRMVDLAMKRKQAGGSARPAHEPSVSERGCVEDQPQRVRIGESAAADAPTPAHSRAPVQGRNAQNNVSGNSLHEPLGRARHSVRAGLQQPDERRARSDAPYLDKQVQGFKARKNVSGNSHPGPLLGGEIPWLAKSRESFP